MMESMEMRLLHGLPLVILAVMAAVIGVGILGAVWMYVGNARKVARRRSSGERVVSPEAAMNDAPLPASLKEGEEHSGGMGHGSGTGHHGAGGE